MISATPCLPHSAFRGRLGGTSWPSSSAALHIPSTSPRLTTPADRALGTTLASQRALDTRRSVAHVLVGSVGSGLPPRRYSPRVHDPHRGPPQAPRSTSRRHTTTPAGPRADRVLGTTLASHRALDTRRSVAHVIAVWARWSGDARPAGRAFGWAPLVDVDTTARLARLVETPTPTLREITHLPPE